MGWESWFSLGIVPFCFGMLAFTRVSLPLTLLVGLVSVFLIPPVWEF